MKAKTNISFPEISVKFLITFFDILREIEHCIMLESHDDAKTNLTGIAL